MEDTAGRVTGVGDGGTRIRVLWGVPTRLRRTHDDPRFLQPFGRYLRPRSPGFPMAGAQPLHAKVSWAVPIHRAPLANSLSWMKRQPARSAAPRSSLAPNAEDVANHHVVMPGMSAVVAKEVVLLDAAWPNERADVVPVRTVQRHHCPIPTEPDDMAVLAQMTRSNSFTGPLLTSSVSSTSNAYTPIAVSSSHSVYSDLSSRAATTGRLRRPTEGPTVAIWAGMGKDKRVRADDGPKCAFAGEGAPPAEGQRGQHR